MVDLEPDRAYMVRALPAVVDGRELPMYVGEGDRRQLTNWIIQRPLMQVGSHLIQVEDSETKFGVRSVAQVFCDNFQAASDRFRGAETEEDRRACAELCRVGGLFEPPRDWVFAQVLLLQVDGLPIASEGGTAAGRLHRDCV